MSILFTIYFFGLFISSLFQKDSYHVSPDGPAAAVAAAAVPASPDVPAAAVAAAAVPATLVVVVVACVAAEKWINKRSRVEKFKLFVLKTYSFVVGLLD